MKSNPLVSIIIPCYNAENWIAETLEHCLAQTYEPIEIIVWDDGSTDNSPLVIKTFGDRVQYYRGENRGGSAARNRGFEKSSGDYVIFHDADDFLSPNTVEAMVTLIRNLEDTIVAVHWDYWIYNGNQWESGGEGVTKQLPPKKDYLHGWLTGWYIPPTGIMWPRHIIYQIQGWDEEIGFPAPNDDGDIIMRALIQGYKFKLIEQGRAYYRQHIHGKASVSRMLSKESWESEISVIQKIEQQLDKKGLLPYYRLPLGCKYGALARKGVGIDDTQARICAKKAQKLAGIQSIQGSFIHRLLCVLLGVVRKEKIARFLSRCGISRKQRRLSAIYEEE